MFGDNAISHGRLWAGIASQLGGKGGFMAMERELLVLTGVFGAEKSHGTKLSQGLLNL